MQTAIVRAGATCYHAVDAVMVIFRGATARVFLAIGCAVLFAMACGRRGNEYPPEVVENFLRACGSRASESACRCALEKVQERYTADQYRALEGHIATTRQAPKELLDIIAACR